MTSEAKKRLIANVETAVSYYSLSSTALWLDFVMGKSNDKATALRLARKAQHWQDVLSWANRWLYA